MAYNAEYQRPYEGGYVNLPSESTPEMAEFINARDDVLIKIEQYLANLNSEYALLTEAGYDLFVGLDANYVLTINLRNKNGKNISHKTVDLPIESMIIDVDYVDGKLVLTLQSGNTVDVDVSDMVRGLVPTTRKIAGIDLADDITKEELVEALDISSGGGVSGDIPTKVSQLENDLGYVTQEDILGAETVSAGEIKPWLYKFGEEEIVGVYNGKPLYQKTFVYNNVAVSSGVASSSNISITLPLGLIDVDKVFIDNAYGVDSGYVYPFPYAHNNPISCVAIFIEGDYQGIAFRFGTEFSATVWSEIVINLKYTKTTDAEGSGNNLKPYGIYDAKLDDIKAEIDEVKNAITETTEATMPNSYEGRLLIEEIGGVCEQGENPSPTSPQEIKKSVVSGVKTHDDNGNESSVTLSKPIDLYGIGDVQDVIEGGKVKRKFVICKVTNETNITQHQFTNDNFMVVTLRYNDLLGNKVGMCTHLPTMSSSFLTKQPCALFEGYGNIIISLPKTLTPNLDSAKQWLIDNDVTFVKGIAETIAEDLPLADQIALNSLSTFDGITYLEFDSEIEPTFEGEYGTSKHGGYTLESLLTARNNELRLSSLEASVVNNI